MKKLIYLFVMAMLVAILFYICFPKYELYQSVGSGLYTYRFNRITGTIQIGDPTNGKWCRAMPVLSIQKP
jgi:hypothetical protein